MNGIDRNNNFHVVRLIAAVQVMILHCRGHLGVVLPGVTETAVDFLKHFPGVPIFFTVSGFLIFWSYERMYGQLGRYFRNRLLRIYPALYACLLVTLTLILINLGPGVIVQNGKAFLIWLAGQLTFFQFYTPEFLRSFGTGVPNGALWTIPVELQFYVLVPLLMWAYKRFGQKAIWAALLISVAYYTWMKGSGESTSAAKLSKVFVLTYLYNFCFGILLYIKWKKVRTWVEGRFLTWLSIYLAFVIVFYYLLHAYVPEYTPSPMGFLANLILSVLTISLAFSFKGLAKRTVGETDISYGVYIYHIPIVNLLLMLGLGGRTRYLFLCFATTFVMALLSWYLVEERFLKLKKIAPLKKAPIVR